MKRTIKNLTYHELAHAIQDEFTSEQKYATVTVEVFEQGQGSECYAAELRICCNQHDSLDDGHPVLFVPSEPE